MLHKKGSKKPKKKSPKYKSCVCNLILEFLLTDLPVHQDNSSIVINLCSVCCLVSQSFSFSLFYSLFYVTAVGEHFEELKCAIQINVTLT